MLRATEGQMECGDNGVFKNHTLKQDEEDKFGSMRTTMLWRA